MRAHESFVLLAKAVPARAAREPQEEKHAAARRRAPKNRTQLLQPNVKASFFFQPASEVHYAAHAADDVAGVRGEFFSRYLAWVSSTHIEKTTFTCFQAGFKLDVGVSFSELLRIFVQCF